MGASTAKQTALKAIENLPESASLEDIMYQLYVLQKVQPGEDSAKSEDTFTVEQLRKDMQTW